MVDCNFIYCVSFIGVGGNKIYAVNIQRLTECFSFFIENDNKN
jgi:hypothetical protein